MMTEFMCANPTEQGFQSSALGPYWKVLHMDSFNFPVSPTNKQQSDTYQWFMETLARLPCEACRLAVQKSLKDIRFDKDLDLVSRTAYSWLVYNLHKKVNENIGKPNKTYAEVNSEYESIRATTSCSRSACSR